MNAPAYAAEVYISYAGNEPGDTAVNSDQLVIELGNRLKQHNLLAKEYKRDVPYKGDLESYMDDIAYGDFIILLVSEKYLTSEYCMYEAISILNRNKRNLGEKIFPVLLPDAQIFNNGKRIEYVDYWDTLFNQLTARLAGKDPLKYGGLNDILKKYREISENIDAFISALAAMCQLSKDLSMEQKYQRVIDAILQQHEKNKGLPVMVQASPAMQSQALAIMPPQPFSSNAAQDVAVLSKSANDFISRVINKVDDIILDSEKAKKEYIDINFEEISGEQEILPATLNFIYSLRTEKAKYEPYRQSLIISALSLGLIKKYDDTKARLLIDFATDDNPVLSNRALAGVVLGLLNKENYISRDITRKLETLKDNIKIQRCLLAIFFILGNVEELHKVSPVLLSHEYKKFEFFNLTQHWFLPFYTGNTVLEKNIPDKKFAAELEHSSVIFGLDSTKYAMALLYSTFTEENKEQFSRFVQLEKSVISSIKTEELQSKLLLEIETTKYILEFYLYAHISDNTALAGLIEDQNGLRTGYLYKRVLNETYQRLLKANQYFFKKAFTEAALILKPVLEDQPNHLEALLMYGYSSYYEGNYAAVIPTFEKLKAKGIKEILPLGMLGDAYFNTGEYEKAIQTYELLITFQETIPTLLSIGRSYELLPVPDMAKTLHYYLRAFKTAPDNFSTLILLGDHYLLRYSEPDYANAFVYYQKAFAIDSNNINLIKAYMHCISHLPQTPFEVAIEVLDKWILLEPANTHPYLLKGDQYANRQPADNLTAFDYYLQAFDIDNTNTKLIQSLDDFIIKAGNIPFDKAARIYTKMIELEPQNPAGYSGMGAACMSLTPPDFDRAFDFYTQEFALAPSANLAVFLFQCAAQLKQPDEKIMASLYEKYKELAPGTAKADLAMADFLALKIEPDAVTAGSYYQAALQLQPNDKEVLLAAGKYYQSAPAPDYRKAFDCLNAYIQQDPDNHLANAYLGWISFVTGRYEAAKHYFEQCRDGDEDGTTHQNLGHLALIEKDMATAKKMYSKGYSLFKNKEDFYPLSVNDFKYIEPAGITRNEFDSVLKEIIETGSRNAVTA